MYCKCITNEFRNAVVIPIFKKGERLDPKDYTGIIIINTWYKIYPKIRNTKLKSHSEQFDRNTKMIPKGTYIHRSNIASNY